MAVMGRRYNNPAAPDRRFLVLAGAARAARATPIEHTERAADRKRRRRIRADHAAVRG
jgi:hypothetical protein